MPPGAATARQGDVDGFRSQTGVQLCLRQRGAAQIQELLDLLLGLVDLRAHLALLLGVEFAQPLEQHGQRAILAQEAGLFVFERGGVLGRGETFLRLGRPGRQSIES